MTAGEYLALAVPFVALVATYLFLSYLQLGLAENYHYYREFWGGNPSEVFSHWLDMALMSGGATIIAWFLSVETLFRRRGQAFSAVTVAWFSFLVSSVVIAIVLDGMHGEGTVIIACLFFFIPMLASSYYLLRRFAALLRWRLSGIIPLCLAFVVLHVVAQLYYEPSGTGAPNSIIIPCWLATVGGALLWAFIRSIRSGLFGRVRRRLLRVGSNPMVWGSTILILLSITLYAQRVRTPHETMAVAWLNELENRLTDAFVAEIKRDHTSDKADKQSRIPISAAAQALLNDARIKGDNTLRIYIPLNQNDYLFLSGNTRFLYCDIRRLAREDTEEIDQDFIDALIASDGTHQTRLYSVLWSPYMAGRVLKDQAGKVKAICVINAP
jgi:hypothetical protein